MNQIKILRTGGALAGFCMILGLASTESFAHNTSVEFDTAHTHSTDRYTSARPNRHGYGTHRPVYRDFARAAEKLEESSDRFRDEVRELRRHRHGNRARALGEEAHRFENLADRLRDIARDNDRYPRKRRQLLGELRDSSARIDYLVGDYTKRRGLIRDWRRARTHLGNVHSSLRIDPHSYGDGSYGQAYSGNNHYAPFYPNRFDGGYNEGGADKRVHGHKGNKQHTNRPKHNNKKPRTHRNVVWASDQVEDASERTKNAYRHHIKANRISNHGWAKRLNGELSAFDQVANKLRASVQSRGNAPRSVYNELQNRRARIDGLMAGKPVGPATRQHWATVVNALGTLGNSY